MIFLPATRRYFYHICSKSDKLKDMPLYKTYEFLSTITHDNLVLTVEDIEKHLFWFKEVSQANEYFDTDVERDIRFKALVLPRAGTLVWKINLEDES